MNFKSCRFVAKLISMGLENNYVRKPSEYGYIEPGSLRYRDINHSQVLLSKFSPKVNNHYDSNAMLKIREKRVKSLYSSEKEYSKANKKMTIKSFFWGIVLCLFKATVKMKRKRS